MATTKLFAPRPYDSLDFGIAGVAPILSTGTDVDNTKVASVQAASVAGGYGTLATSAGGTAPAPFAAPLRDRGPWQTNTVYSYGDVVTQGGSVYVAPISFTSGSSFVSANWTKLGLYDATDPSLAATYANLRKETLRRFPRVNTVLPAEMTTPPTFALTGPGGASPIAGGSPQAIAYNSAQVKLRGAVPALVTQFSTDYYYNAANAGWTPPPMWPTFDYYGSDLALRFRPRTGNANDQKVWVWVDGVPATPAPVGLGTLSAGSLYRYRLTFSEGVALRRISIWTNLMDFGGLDVGVTDTVAYPTQHEEKVAIYGDSWVEGANSVDDIDLWGEQLPWYLGMEGFRIGQGGTGYVHNPSVGGKAPYTDATRLAQLVATGADWVIVFGSINDDPESGIQAAATTVYAAIAAGLPNAKVIVVGPPGTSGSPTANRLANRTAISAAAAAASNVATFIDPIASGWITGTGHVGGTVGDGNADVLIASDGAHPNDADAHAYWRSRVRSALATFLAA